MASGHAAPHHHGRRAQGPAADVARLRHQRLCQRGHGHQGAGARQRSRGAARGAAGRGCRPAWLVAAAGRARHRAAPVARASPRQDGSGPHSASPRARADARPAPARPAPARPARPRARRQRSKAPRATLLRPRCAASHRHLDCALPRAGYHCATRGLGASEDHDAAAKSDRSFGARFAGRRRCGGARVLVNLPSINRGIPTGRGSGCAPGEATATPGTRPSRSGSASRRR